MQLLNNKPIILINTANVIILNYRLYLIEFCYEFTRTKVFMGNKTENCNEIKIAWKNVFFRSFCYLIPLLLAILSNQIKSSIHAYENLGLDASWAWSLNYFFSNSYIFGRDIVFTYGPIGWLVNSAEETVGITIWFWIAMIFITAYVMYESVVKIALLNRQWFRFFIFTLTFLYAFFCNTCFPEYFILYLYCLTVLTYVFSSNCYTLLAVASIILGISFFLKFSLAIQIVAFVTALCFGLLLFRNKLVKVLLLHVLLSFIVCCGIYLVFYSHSGNDLLNYFVGSINQAIGYNWAMSIGDGHRYSRFLTFAIVYLFIFATITVFNVKDERNLPLLIAIFSVLFFTYKHGFVRGDGHIYIFFNGVIPFLGLFLLFFRETKHSLRLTLNLGNLSLINRNFNRNFVDCIIFIMIMVSLVLLKHFNSLIDIKNSVDSKLSDYSGYIEYVKTTKSSQNADLPQGFIDRIKNQRVSIYPIYLQYARNQKLNLVPLFALQAYSGYTAWLDEKSSEKFGLNNGPEYVIFNRDTIDNRYPFIEMPMTYLELLKNYAIDYYDSAKDLFLLKKRKKSLFSDEDIVYKKTETFKITEQVQINDSSNNIMVKFNIKYSLWGKFLNFIYKTPSVDMIIAYDDGTKTQRRVILQNLTNGFLVSTVPNSSFDLFEIFNSNRSNKHVSSVQFVGQGLNLFSKHATVEFYTVNIPKQNNQVSLERAETIDFKSVEINGTPIKINGDFCLDEYFINEYNVFLRGWMFNRENGNPFEEIYLKIGDLLYKIDQIPRQDVVDYFKLVSDSNKLGFSIFSEYLADNKLDVNKLVFVVKKDSDHKYYYLER